MGLSEWPWNCESVPTVPARQHLSWPGKASRRVNNAWRQRPRTHACGCSCAGRVACVAPSLPRLPRPPGVCECSGSSVLGGSCSASRRLEHTHTHTQTYTHTHTIHRGSSVARVSALLQWTPTCCCKWQISVGYTSSEISKVFNFCRALLFRQSMEKQCWSEEVTNFLLNEIVLQVD